MTNVFSIAPDGEIFHSATRALCPKCRTLVDAVRVLRGGKVYLRKACPTHGHSSALISGDAEWFRQSLTCIKPGQIPLQYSTQRSKGCPWDCGLCQDHEQHTCLPVIEVTNHCNMKCPICIVRNRNDYHMSREEFAFVIDGLIAKEGKIDTVNVSGGEPTVHPRLLDLLDAAARPEIQRVSLSTNGVRIAEDISFCRELASRRIYVNLQLDGTEDNALERLRGKGAIAEMKQRALDNLENAGVATTLIATVARGVNETRIGECIKLLLDRDFILSLMFQPAAYTGSGGGSFSPHDSMDIITIPDVVRLAEEQTGGALRKTDFLPLPCSHPSCFALTYLLKTENGFVPFPRFIDADRYINILANRGVIRPNEEFEETIQRTIHDLWTSSGQIPDSPRVLNALKRALQAMYPDDRAVEQRDRIRIGERLVKTIFIHAFMDEETFDLERIRKCCTHYALPDGRLMPACAYNMFYRERER